MIVCWVNADDTVIIANAALPVVQAGAGPASRGLGDTFAFAYGRVAAPDGSSYARLVIESSSGAGAYTVSALKPYLGPVQFPNKRARWDPGIHSNADLQLPVWPPSLGDFLAEALPTPITNATSFSTDVGIPVRRDLYAALQYEFKPHLRCLPADVDALNQFYDDNRATFFVVRQDTDQLCIAEWLADGAPTAKERRGGFVLYECGLHLVTA